MSKIFIEYKIHPEFRDKYLAFMRARVVEHPELSWYEGTDQPGLFVEIWDNQSFEQFESFKRERTVLQGKWRQGDDCIHGGIAALHIWHFTEMN